MTILVVEDDLLTRKLLTKILQRATHEVIQAENGPLALQAIDKTKVDLIIVDIMMPEMTGLDLLRRLKEDPRTAKTPVIMCTTVSNRDTVLEAISLGISGYVLKPVSANELLKKVNEAKQHRR
jgi:CheY-like chemotaxis protein